jgi:RTX calcium-binding nonapeptide repeat (4 copies)
VWRQPLGRDRLGLRCSREGERGLKGVDVAARTSLQCAFAVVVAVLSCALPSSASATRVGREPPPDFVGTTTTLFFVAAPGEANDVTVSPAGRSLYRFEDRAAPLEIGAGCRATSDSHVALCDRPLRHAGLVVRLGDQRDAIRLGVADGLVHGGLDDDRLTGGRFDDRFEGGSGDDRIAGGGGTDGIDGDEGDDTVSGGAGDDVLAGGPGSDLLDGGGGNDTLLPNDYIRFPTVGAGQRPDARGGTDLLRGGTGVDVIVYRYEVRPRAPALTVRLNGRADDGPRGDDDNFAADTERAYSFASRLRCQRRRRRRLCSIGTFAILSRPGPNGEFISPQGNFSLRIYRFSRRGGETRTEEALFETLNAGTVGVSEGRSRTGPSRIALPKGRLPGCPRLATASQLSRQTLRRLRGRARGHYTAGGRYSAGAVRGTDWTVTERCDGTLTSVRRGTVVVRDFRRRKTIVLHAGERYLARAPR